jgi:cytochrome P450
MQVAMILYEVLRLYPPAIAFVRKAYKEMVIGGITYPAGMVLELLILFIHHDPNIWGSDAHEFRPDREATRMSSGLIGLQRGSPNHPRIQVPSSHLVGDPASASARTWRCWKQRWQCA